MKRNRSWFLIYFYMTALLLPSFGQRVAPKWKGIWEPVSYPDDIHFLDVFFATANEGWVGGGATEMAGGLIIHTSDGGDHWDVQYGDPQSSERAIGEFRFLDATHGWAVQRTGSACRLLHTRDGKLWIVAGTIDENHTDYMFTSETTGVSLSKDIIKTTRDGGRSWQPAAPCAAKIQVNGLFQNVVCEWRRVQFVSPMVAYAIGKAYESQLFLAKTVDGGATWAMSTQELTARPEDAFFIDENTGYVRTGAADTGQIYKTMDGGRTWTGQATSPGNRMQFADPEVGWALHYRKVSFTTDGGNRWNSREYPFPVSGEALSLPRRDRGYVAGQHGMIYRYRIVPVEYAAKGMIPAPLLSGIDSPLDSQLQQLTTQIQAIARDVGAPPAADSGAGSAQELAGALPGCGAGVGGSAPATSGSGFKQSTTSVAPAGGPANPAAAGRFTQDTTSAAATFNSVSTAVPQFVARYRNLNLLLTGFQVSAQMPAAVECLGQSFQSLKAANPQSAPSLVTNMQGQVGGLSRLVQLALQKQ